MAELKQFKFSRGRGIAWVCDVSNSTRYLNTNDGADRLEEFLPRFYWTASIIVQAAGGEFLKWKGDGFLAWFRVSLDREMGAEAAKVFEALWHLSLLVNVTQLAVDGGPKFRIRHGVAYEPDALLIHVKERKAAKLDVIGRAVVFAFRLSGIPADFPHVVARGDVVSAYMNTRTTITQFRRWRPSRNERLQHFKGERWGTDSIYKSDANPRQSKRTVAVNSVLGQTKRAIAKVEGVQREEPDDSSFALEFLQRFGGGPAWCQKTLDLHLRFIQRDLLGTLKQLAEKVKKS